MFRSLLYFENKVNKSHFSPATMALRPRGSDWLFFTDFNNFSEAIMLVFSRDVSYVYSFLFCCCWFCWICCYLESQSRLIWLYRHARKNDLFFWCLMPFFEKANNLYHGVVSVGYVKPVVLVHLSWHQSVSCIAYPETLGAEVGSH